MDYEREVILAKSAGFCFGVERAIDLVHTKIEANEKDKKIYTFGPIIHNDEVVKELSEKGVGIINEKDEIKDIKGAVLVIRSHGAAEDIYEEAGKYEVEIADATCPFVKKIHKIVREESEKGSDIVIIGDKNHPEVKGIIGWAKSKVYVIKTPGEAQAFEAEKNTPLCVVSQTTFNLSKFQDIVEIIAEKEYYINVINTICNATQARQKEAESVSKQVDTMIVIGDEKSSNSQKLYEICKKYCDDTYFIQTVRDLANTHLQSGLSVGITAGASTPNNIIQEVLLNVRGKKL